MNVYVIKRGKKKKLSRNIKTSSIIPRAELKAPDVNQQMIQPKVKVEKIYWMFRKDDPDFNPSVPHGHSLDKKYKIELWTGDIYEVQNNKLVKRAKKKDMMALYSFPGFLDFVDECRDAYVKLNPNFLLQPLKFPAGFVIGHKRSSLSVRKKYHDYDAFIVEMNVCMV